MERLKALIQETIFFQDSAWAHASASTGFCPSEVKHALK